MRSGYLLFSDIPGNVIRKWTPDDGAADFRRPSGYDGDDAPRGAFVGSNGLAADRQGRIIICEHGNRRVTRLEKNGAVTVLAATYGGKRLNSPNDVVVKSDGSIYFTDPPSGLRGGDNDAAKELPFNGVYRVTPEGKITLLTKEITRPNGLAFSPDEKFLFVANADRARKAWLRFAVRRDGTLGPGALFFDASSRTEDGVPDGMKVDAKGNLYCAGPGGVWIFSPEGRHLGTIKPPETPANVQWGKYARSNREAAMAAGEKADTLYITARTSLYRVHTATWGIIR
ncbi:MAG: SMP-30/gluconolactonase/LRE family protein [Acidobacteriia bacterium]|nr:SMP-30/gluconolactonase/LRE family protein [Terriglobia bacterium]